MPAKLAPTMTMLWTTMVMIEIFCFLFFVFCLIDGGKVSQVWLLMVVTRRKRSKSEIFIIYSQFD